MKLVTVCCISLGVVLHLEARALTITTTSDPNVLAAEILGPGITISNATYTGATGAAGKFSGGVAAGIGIESGIILTTGAASLAPGPNEDDGAGVDNNLPGDSDLTNLLPSGGSTFDATIVEFDFTTDTGNLFFRFVFASEEYNEFVNSEFNDVFGFFLNGVNIALVPGTSTPVAINNVNGGNPFGTDATHPEFFNNNSLTDPGPAVFDIQYDGFTQVFTAQALGLAPGTHRIKLAIADASDGILDSAVFIETGTFSGIPEPATAALVVLSLASLCSLLRRRPPGRNG